MTPPIKIALLTVDIVHAVDIVRAAHAVDIVHAVHTLDIAIAIVIVIAKATNTRSSYESYGSSYESSYGSSYESSYGSLCYDYDYGYGYVKSVDSMDNVNSVRCGNGLDNVNSTNNAVIRRRGGAAGMKGALLSTLSMLLKLSALRTLLKLSMLSTLLT